MGRNLDNQSKDNNSHDKENLEAQELSTNREVSQWKKGGNTAQSPARVRDASEEIDEGKNMWKKGGTRVQPPYRSERVGEGYRDMRGRDGYSDRMPNVQDRSDKIAEERSKWKKGNKTQSPDQDQDREMRVDGGNM